MPPTTELQEILPSEGVIRCPAIRSLVIDGKLKHENLKIAAVQELVRVLSGQPRDLSPSEPGSLANVAGFFAILNHGTPEQADGHRRGIAGWFRALFQKRRNIRDAAAVASGKPTSRLFDLRLFRSPGDQPGTVNFFKNDKHGEFQNQQFISIITKVSDGESLTIQGIAKMIITANNGAWDDEGSVLDLAKSAGEWALMVCALRVNQSTTDISVADLERLYSQAGSSQKILMGTALATAREWVKVTAQIAAAIAKEKGQVFTTIAGALHRAFKNINAPRGEMLCPCRTCNPEIWRELA